jgi:predicted small metal-binding protein
MQAILIDLLIRSLLGQCMWMAELYLSSGHGIEVDMPRKNEEYRTRPTNPEGTSTETYFGSTNARANPERPGVAPQARADLSFRCADAGLAMCPWEVTGKNEDEVIRLTEDHMRATHELHEEGEHMRNRIRTGIRRRAA